MVIKKRVEKPVIENENPNRYTKLSPYNGKLIGIEMSKLEEDGILIK